MLIKRTIEETVRKVSQTFLKAVEAEPSEEDYFAGTAHLKTKIGTGAVVCMASDMMPIDKKNWYVPAWLI